MSQSSVRLGGQTCVRWEVQTDGDLTGRSPEICSDNGVYLRLPCLPVRLFVYRLPGLPDSVYRTVFTGQCR